MIGKVGVVERISDGGDIHARWGLIRWMFHPAVFTKVGIQRLSDVRSRQFQVEKF